MCETWKLFRRSPNTYRRYSEAAAPCRITGNGGLRLRMDQALGLPAHEFDHQYREPASLSPIRCFGEARMDQAPQNTTGLSLRFAVSDGEGHPFPPFHSNLGSINLTAARFSCR